MSGEMNPPSRVLHVRNIAPDTVSEDLIQFVSSFGKVAYVTLLTKFNQALVEMETIESATNVLEFSKRGPVYIKERPVVFSFSKSPSIKRRQDGGNVGAPGAVLAGGAMGMGGGHGGMEPAVSNVLLVTIYNPLHPITCDVLFTIMSPYGLVLRVIIFTKNSVQAMVEFAEATSAVAAKTALDGRDIYSGSCTLKIVFSTQTKLNIKVNNDKSRDYTNPALPTSLGGPSSMGGQAPFGGAGQSSFGGGNQGVLSQPGGHMGGHGMQQQMGGMMGGQMGMGGMPGMQPQMGMGGGGGMGGQPSGSTSFYSQPSNNMNEPRPMIIAHGFADNVTCDHVFNVFCQFGNIVKVKLLPNKPGSALVQFENTTQADLCVSLMGHSGATLFGRPLVVGKSKHTFIAESRNPVENQATKSYAGSQLNRFTHHPAALKNMCRPSTVLYFTNVPMDASQDMLNQSFGAVGAPMPQSYKFFERPDRKSKSGIMECGSIDAATSILALANHCMVNGTHTLKLSYSAQAFGGGQQHHQE